MRGGARLHAPNLAIPNRFMLHIAGIPSELACDIVWRRGFVVGVRFIRLKPPA